MQQEFAARLILPGSTFRTLPGVQGNRPELLPVDIALALARAPPNAVHAWRWRYCLDGTSIRPLSRLLEHASHELARRELWHEESVPLVVGVVLAEEAWPAKWRTDSGRARQSGMLLSTWRRRCKKPHARLGAIVDQLVGDAERVLARRLGGLSV